MQMDSMSTLLPDSEFVPIHASISQQAQRIPNAVAFRCGVLSLSYQNLDSASTQLAYHLRSINVQKGDSVAVALPRSFELIISIIGILKAGGVYVPLDPSYPSWRLQKMLSDSEAGVLLLHHSYESLLKFHGTTVFLDEDANIIRTWPTTGEPIDIAADDTAYILYTSGSTGMPKGVEGRHEALSFRCGIESKILQAEDIVCQKTSISFIDSLCEIFSPLLRGLPTVIIPKEQMMDLQVFVEVLAKEGVTRLMLVPSLLQAMMDIPGMDQHRLPMLRTFILSGEELRQDLCCRFSKAFPNAELINLYGTTEAWDITYYTVNAVEASSPVPIGKPLPSMRVRILDSKMRRVPTGQIGELYVGGPTLAKGYRNQPKLTYEKFISDPFASSPGSVFYRTGDLARVREDGNIEYLGRIDHQVKIRGVRIEVGEIEAVIRQFPDIFGAVVVARADHWGNKRLVAYVAGDSVPERDLRAFLKNHLPNQMLPSSYIFLADIPLTPSGKVDRSSLPPPPNTVQIASPYIIPRNPDESLIADIYAEVLGLEKVSATDDFFDLGGDSLSAARVTAYLSRAYGRIIHLRLLIAHSKVSDLASVVGVSQPEETSQAPSLEQLSSDSVLDDDIWPENEVDSLQDYNLHHIFLTGATGFLGAYIMRELLNNTTARIHCLVRAEGPEHAMRRIQYNLLKFGFEVPQWPARVSPIVGDISLPRFGLSKNSFHLLTKQIDAIYHNAAYVHFIHDYSRLMPVNVNGTREVIQLACQARIKPIFYISTLATVDTFDNLGQVIEERPITDKSDPPWTGYAQSKWVSELLLTEAAARGIPVSIYRIDDIAGDSQSGLFKPDDFIWLWLKGCIQLGCAPEIDIHEYMVPVDQISKALVYLSRHFPGFDFGQPRIFHLCNPHPVPWNRLVDFLISFGYKIDKLPFTEWKSRLTMSRELEKGNALIPLISLFTESIGSNQYSFVEMYQDGSRPIYDDYNTQRHLKRSGLNFDPVNRDLFYTYLNAFIREGFLPLTNQIKKKTDRSQLDLIQQRINENPTNQLSMDDPTTHFTSPR